MKFVGLFLSRLFAMSEEEEEIVEEIIEEEEDQPVASLKRETREEEPEEIVEEEPEEEEITPAKKTKTSPPPPPATKDEPLDIQNKRMRFYKDTPSAILEVDTATNQLHVKVKRGIKGRKEKQLPPYVLLKDKAMLKQRIGEEMEKKNMVYLDSVLLVQNFPDLYWNAVFFMKKNIGLIDDFLKDSGFCSKQRRRR